MSAHAEGVTEVKTFASADLNDKRFDYVLGFLKLILEKTKPTHGDYKLTYVRGISQPDRLKFLKNKKINLAYYPMTSKYPSGIVPVTFPLRHGVLGHRLLVINKADEAKFAQIKTFSDLLKLKMGFMSEWFDFHIYKDAGFTVVAAPVGQYKDLYKLLAEKKIDFFPRSVMEITDEMALVKAEEMDLVIEKTLLLYYPLDEYFYVNESDKKLLERINKGIELTIKDGSHEKYFDDYYKETFKKLKLSSRRVITINNNALPAVAPITDSHIWKRPEVLYKNY